MRVDQAGLKSTQDAPRWLVFALVTAVVILHPVHSARAIMDVWRQFRADQ